MTILEKNDKCIQKAYKILNENKIYPEIWSHQVLPVIFIQIDNGDWKHEHLKAKLLLEEQGFAFLGKEELGESPDDTYSAIHRYICSSVEC